MTGCASGAATGETAAATTPTSTSPATDPGVAEQAALVDSVRSAYTPADVDFMAGMIHHHAQALVMSRMAPGRGASPDLQILAERIINAQKDEIALMQRWLRDRGEAVPEPEAGAARGPHHEHAMMPGMLSEEQMARLDDARREEFDRLFLQFMIQHHRGAVIMVEELVANPGAAREETVFKLASDIGADQASEITRMRTMLRDLLFSPGREEP